MIHFLISHSISLYCQREQGRARERGKGQIDTHVNGRDTQGGKTHTKKKGGGIEESQIKKKRNSSGKAKQHVTLQAD